MLRDLLSSEMPGSTRTNSGRSPEGLYYYVFSSLPLGGHCIVFVPSVKIKSSACTGGGDGQMARTIIKPPRTSPNPPCPACSLVLIILVLCLSPLPPLGHVFSPETFLPTYPPFPSFLVLHLSPPGLHSHRPCPPPPPSPCSSTGK